MAKKIQKAADTVSSIYNKKLTKDSLHALNRAVEEATSAQGTAKRLQKQAEESITAASTASAHYKDLLAASKRAKEAATQANELLDKLPNTDINEDSSSSDSKVSDKEFGPRIRTYAGLLE